MGNRKFRKIGVGGTFEIIHSGHIKLISTALSLGNEVIFGITSDDFASKYKNYKVKPLRVRVLNLKSIIHQIDSEARYSIEILDDPYGSAVNDNSMNAIVVSIETLLRAFEINEIRSQRKLKPLHLIVIPMIRNGYGEKISVSLIKSLIASKESSRSSKNI